MWFGIITRNACCWSVNFANNCSLNEKIWPEQEQKLPDDGEVIDGVDANSVVF